MTPAEHARRLRRVQLALAHVAEELRELGHMDLELRAADIGHACGALSRDDEITQRVTLPPPEE